MLDWFESGGPLMYVIAAGGVFGALLFFERLLHLHRAQINPRTFLQGIYTNLKRDNVLEAVTLCEETPGPVARIAQAAILHREEPAPDLRRAVEDAGRAEIPRLEQHIVILATLARVLPLIGLTGTILGLIETLSIMNANAPLVHSGDLTGGMAEALMTTAAGLIAAIPLAIAYHVLIGRVESLLADMEAAAIDVTGFLAHADRHAE